jgi:hypothetical protein
MQVGCSSVRRRCSKNDPHGAGFLGFFSGHISSAENHYGTQGLCPAGRSRASADEPVSSHATPAPEPGWFRYHTNFGEQGHTDTLMSSAVGARGVLNDSTQGKERAR